MEKVLGKVHLITGPGKGKTTGAFGVALRAAGHGLRVCIVQFMKTGMTSGESIAVKRIPEISLYQFGTGKFADSKRPTADDRRSAAEALAKARAILNDRECDMIILDEVNMAASFGLIEVKDVLDLLDNRGPGVEAVLTGRNAPKELVDYADYVSYIDSKKHPYDKGLKARKGIEW